MTYGYCTVKERVNTQLLLDPGKTSGLVSYAMGVHSTMHEHEPFFIFYLGREQEKFYCVSVGLGRERENPNTFPSVWEENGKTQMSFP